MMKYFLIYLVLLTSILFSCTDKVTDIDLPAVESKPVVTCYLSPQDSIITLILTRTIPANVIDTASYYITDASVEISQGNLVTNLVYNPEFRYYKADTSQFKIREGVTYFLKITTKDNKVIHSSCTIPTIKLQFNSYKTDPISSEEMDYIVNLTNPNASPVYCSFQICYKINVPGTLDTILYGIYNDLHYLENPLNNKDFKKHFNVSGSVSLYRPYICFNDPFGIKVLVCDKDYYEFHISLYATGNSNPYQTQPIYYYSNIEGGLGIFASYCIQ